MEETNIQTLKDCSYDLSVTVEFITNQFHGFSATEAYQRMSHHYPKTQIEQVVALAVSQSNQEEYSDKTKKWAAQICGTIPYWDRSKTLASVDHQIIEAMAQFLRMDSP